MEALMHHQELSGWFVIGLQLAGLVLDPPLL